MIPVGWTIAIAVASAIAGAFVGLLVAALCCVAGNADRHLEEQ